MVDCGWPGLEEVVELLLYCSMYFVVILFLVGGHPLCATSITLGRREQSVSKRPIINAACHGDLALGIRLGRMN